MCVYSLSEGRRPKPPRLRQGTQIRMKRTGSWLCNSLHRQASSLPFTQCCSVAACSLGCSAHALHQRYIWLPDMYSTLTHSYSLIAILSLLLLMIVIVRRLCGLFITWGLLQSSAVALFVAAASCIALIFPEPISRTITSVMSHTTQHNPAPYQTA